MIKDILKYSISNLWHRKLRSFLTILSILIGITAIFALVSFGQGIQKYVNDLSKEQGTDKIIMMPGGFVPPGSSNVVFTDKDVDFIKKIKGVTEATGIIAATGKIKFRDYKEKYTYVFGLSTNSEERKLMEEISSGIEVIKGRNLKKGDVHEAVLGYNFMIPDKLFKKEISVGDTIEINDIPVKVIGFYNQIGNSQDDSQVYLSQEGAKKIFGKEDYEYVYIRSQYDQNAGEIASKIKEKFRNYRNQKEGEEDFGVQTYEDVIKIFTSIITILNGVLVLIALISIIVAAVNIANTMYTSVLERIPEIGVMKSIGAKNNFILLVFIIESGILGLIGGIIGVILGYLIAKAGEFIARSYGLIILKPDFPWWLIIGCLLFAFLVGAGSGLLPAMQASKQKPVDALRYE